MNKSWKTTTRPIAVKTERLPKIPVRLKDDATIRLDERWKSELSGEMLDYFNRNGSSLNHYLGYGS